MEKIFDLINKCACQIERNFIEDSFKYFNEKDLHFTFQEYWKKTCPKGPFHIHREYPVLVKGTEFGNGQQKENRNAFIDIVITEINKNNGAEKPIFGIEMFLGKFIDECIIENNSREYVCTNSNLTAEAAMEHLNGDIYKLKKTTPDNYFLLYFIVHSFSISTSGRRRERIVRISQITEMLRSNSNLDQNRLVIIEVLFENGIKTNRKNLELCEIKPPLSICNDNLVTQPSSYFL